MLENNLPPPDNQIGRKTFFWYRVYCAILVVLYLLVTVFGAFLVFGAPLKTSKYDEQELLIAGVIYAVLGAVFFLIFAVAFFLPPKPYNWIVGIVMIAIGMTSCCFVPVCVPLLIFWLKPETKAFFGRN